MKTAGCLPGSAERLFRNMHAVFLAISYIFIFTCLKYFRNGQCAELLHHPFKGNYFITLPRVNTAADMHQHTLFTQTQRFIIQALVEGPPPPFSIIDKQQLHSPLLSSGMASRDNKRKEVERKTSRIGDSYNIVGSKKTELNLM